MSAEAMPEALDFREAMEARILSRLAGPAADRLTRNKGFRFQIACHEASHVLAGYSLGLRVVQATTHAERYSDGSWSMGAVAFSEQAAWKPGGAVRHASPGDVMGAIIVISWIAPAGQWSWRYGRRELRRYRQQADEFVNRYWAEIQALAVELLWTRTLGAEELAAILGRMRLEKINEFQNKTIAPA